MSVIGACGVAVNVDDNIVTNHSGYGIRTWSGAVVNYIYNDLWQNALGATDGNPVDDGGNISADPLYNPDHTLGAGSPCINAASGGSDMGRLFDECGCAPPLVEVTIDIKPGSDPNCINLDSNGVIPVAILGSATFEASDVDPSTVTLEGAAVRLKGKSGNYGSLEDVNHDGYPDLVVHIMDFSVSSGATTATLTGELFDGTPIEGSDSLCIVPPE